MTNTQQNLPNFNVPLVETKTGLITQSWLRFLTNLFLRIGGPNGTVVATVAGTSNRITSTGGSDPIIDISPSYIGQTSITTLGTITTGVWNGTAINEAHGGTNQTTYVTGDILYASATNTLSTLPIGATNKILTVTAGLPAWTFAINQNLQTVDTVTFALITGTRINPRVVSMADATSFTPTGDSADINTQSNTQMTGTLMANAPSGTPVDGQKLELVIKSTNIQTFAWNAIYAGCTTTALPTASTGGTKTDKFFFQYNALSTKWEIYNAEYGY